MQQQLPSLRGEQLSLRTQVLGSAQLALLDAEQWDALTREAVCENPFYARQYLLAGLETIDRAADLRAIAVWNDSNDLVGLFPFRSRWGIAVGAANNYQFSGTPLVHRDYAPAVVSRWLTAIADDQAPPVWRLRDVHMEGDLARLIEALAVHHGLEISIVQRYSRPRLSRLRGGMQAHLDKVVSKSRRKDIERSLRRLREHGVVRFERVEEPAALASRLEQFLLLEQAGWKGANKTAFLSHPYDTAFARAAFGAREGAPGLSSIDALLLNEIPIALNVNIACGGTLFTPKGAYDEAWRKFNPGLVLEYLVIERFYEDQRFEAMDASTTVDGHVVQGLWNELTSMGTILVGRRGLTGLAERIVTAHDTLKSITKVVLATAGRGASKQVTRLPSLSRQDSHSQAPTEGPFAADAASGRRTGSDNR